MSAVHAFFSLRNEMKNRAESTILQCVSENKKGTESSVKDSNLYHVAVQGCCHGELTHIYDECQKHERSTGEKIDLLICCGDFQAIRTTSDLCCMAAPQHHLKVGDFHEYWSSDPKNNPPKRIAPYLTVFVGGNHENSEWLADEYYGGFLAPNIYYIGHSGVIIVDNCICIAGLSGIFFAPNYNRPYPSRPFCTSDHSKRSAYHVRQVEVNKLHAFFSYVRQFYSNNNEAARTEKDDSGEKKLSLKHDTTVNIFVSHDWPVGITKFGREDRLLVEKPFFSDDISSNRLGNPYTLSLLNVAQPDYWVAAHLHCYFRATVPHPIGSSNDIDITLASTNKKCNTKVSSHSTLDDSDRNSSPSGITKFTSFIALDKCSHNFRCLDFIDIPLENKTRTGNKLLEEAYLGQGRVKRHLLWTHVLLASHSLVAQNKNTDQLFDFSFIQAAVKNSIGTSRSGNVQIEACLSTTDFLHAFGLQPPLPLSTSSSPLPPFSLSLKGKESVSYQSCEKSRMKYEAPPLFVSSKDSSKTTLDDSTTETAKENHNLWKEDLIGS